jgi:hypothetical protein
MTRIVGPGLTAERRQQVHDHATVAIDRPFSEPAMAAQEILERYDRFWDGGWRGGWCGADNLLYGQEPHEPAYSVHVTPREPGMTPGTAAAAIVCGEPGNDALIDRSSRDTGQPQPCREMPRAARISKAG